MGNFKIDFNFPSKDIKIKLITLYPNISESQIKLLNFETLAKLNIIIDNKTQIPPWREMGEDIDYTDTEYLWDFFYILLEEVTKINDGKEHRVDFVDDPLYLVFQRINHNIRISFNSTKEEIGKTEVPFEDFLIEVLEKSNNFIQVLLEINPSLKDCDLVNKIKMRIEKVEQITN